MEVACIYLKSATPDGHVLLFHYRPVSLILQQLHSCPCKRLHHPSPLALTRFRGRVSVAQDRFFFVCTCTFYLPSRGSVCCTDSSLPVLVLPFTQTSLCRYTSLSWPFRACHFSLYRSCLHNIAIHRSFTMKSSYVHVRRSETTRQRPILDLDPVNVSLTEGTDIPAPPKELDTAPEVPELPTLRSPTQEDRVGEKPRSASRSSGPLSSHPVSPIHGGNREPGRSAFPFDQQSGALANRSARPGTASSAPLASTHQSKPSAGGDITTAPNHQDNRHGPSPAGNMNPPPSKNSSKGDQPPSYQEYQDSAAPRPSFASRFLRFRSFSSLRSRNASSATLADQLNSTATSARPSTDVLGATGPRGQKRPGSPSIFTSSSMGPRGTTPNGDARGMHSFPRMVRKKSMDLFGSARRRSGMWGRPGDEQSAMEEEAAREEQRELAEKEDYNGRSGSRMDTMRPTGDRSSTRAGSNTDSAMSDVQRTLSGRTDITHSPLPVLPEMDESFGQGLQGESMFDGIGRD